MGQQTANRWVIAAAGVVMQVALGAVYAWSVFKNPLIDAFGWTGPEVQLTFSITILTLGFAAFFGGLWMRQVGPRTVGMASGLLYGLGVFLASFAANNIWVLYATYGLLGGIGIGLGYIVPVATLVKWFPDRRGFITGMAVAGFGAGALITAPIARTLISSIGVLTTFAYLGIAYLILVVGAACLMKNPPEGFRPAGWQPTQAQLGRTARDNTLGEALKSWQWYALWSLLFLNVTAGIAVIAEASPMTQEITGVEAGTAAALVAMLGIPNGLGRFFWAWLSDAIGRKWVFLLMFLLQAAIFFVLPLVSAFIGFSVLVLIVLLCYGGGFGTMPAFTADYFGAKNVGTIYGLMLTAWGFGGVLGPLLIAFLRASTGAYSHALYVIAGIMLVSASIPFIIRPPHGTEERSADAVREQGDARANLTQERGSR